MKLSRSKIQQKYKKEIKKIETELKEAESDGTKERQLEKIHKRLDVLTQKLKEIEQEVKAKEGERQMYFFHRSPVAVALITFFTGGIYSVYWFYKHWKIIHQSSGERTHPILSAIFQVFTVYPLFSRIKEKAQQSGYNKFSQDKAAAIAFILVYVFSASMSFPSVNIGSQLIAFIVLTLVLSLCYALILASVQKAANARNVAVLGENHKFRRLYVGEFIFAASGVALVILSFVSVIAMANGFRFEPESSEVKVQRIKVDKIQSKFDACSKQLEETSASLDESNESAVNQYNAAYDSCEKIRVELNEEVDEYNRRLFSW